MCFFFQLNFRHWTSIFRWGKTKKFDWNVSNIWYYITKGERKFEVKAFVTYYFLANFAIVIVCLVSTVYSRSKDCSKIEILHKKSKAVGYCYRRKGFKLYNDIVFVKIKCPSFLFSFLLRRGGLRFLFIVLRSGYYNK